MACSGYHSSVRLVYAGKEIDDRMTRIKMIRIKMTR
jgi:hypothetical protein